MLLVVVRRGIEDPCVIPSTKKFGNGPLECLHEKKRSAILAMNAIFFVVDVLDAADDFRFERQAKIGMR